MRISLPPGGSVAKPRVVNDNPGAVVRTQVCIANFCDTSRSETAGPYKVSETAGEIILNNCLCIIRSNTSSTTPWSPFSHWRRLIGPSGTPVPTNTTERRAKPPVPTKREEQGLACGLGPILALALSTQFTPKMPLRYPPLRKWLERGLALRVKVFRPFSLRSEG